MKSYLENIKNTSIEELDVMNEEINQQINTLEEEFKPIRDEFLKIQKEYQEKEAVYLEKKKQLNKINDRILNEKNLIQFGVWKYNNENYQYLGSNSIDTTYYHIPNKGFIYSRNGEKRLLVPMRYIIKEDLSRDNIFGYGKCSVNHDVLWKNYERENQGSYFRVTHWRDCYLNDEEEACNEFIPKIGYVLLEIFIQNDDHVVCAKWNWSKEYEGHDVGYYDTNDFIRIAFDLDKMNIQIIEDYEAFMNLEEAPIKF